MKKITFFLFFLLLVNRFSFAQCIIADALWEKEDYARALNVYEQCAYAKNDAVAQYKLARFYLDGNEQLQQDIRHALFFFRLAAENGYALAQRDLAILMETLENLGDVGVNAIIEWKGEMLQMGFSDKMSSFAWALLAAEKTENKWFYPSPTDFDEDAAALADLWTEKKGPIVKAEAIRQASNWKQSRLLQTAKLLLPKEEYEKFLEVMTSTEKGEEARDRKKKAMDDLKKVWEAKKD